MRSRMTPLAVSPSWRSSRPHADDVYAGLQQSDFDGQRRARTRRSYFRRRPVRRRLRSGRDGVPRAEAEMATYQSEQTPDDPLVGRFVHRGNRLHHARIRQQSRRARQQPRARIRRRNHGAVVAFVGIFVQIAARSHMLDAVNIFNDTAAPWSGAPATQRARRNRPRYSPSAPRAVSSSNICCSTICSMTIWNVCIPYGCTPFSMSALSGGLFSGRRMSRARSAKRRAPRRRGRAATVGPRSSRCAMIPESRRRCGAGSPARPLHEREHAVDRAHGVGRVERRKKKVAVSAALSAISIDSSSRISPRKMTSDLAGARRGAPRRTSWCRGDLALADRRRDVAMEKFDRSSIVTMWSARV